MWRAFSLAFLVVAGVLNPARAQESPIPLVTLDANQVPIAGTINGVIRQVNNLFNNPVMPTAAQNLGIGLGSAVAPGATALVAGGSGYVAGEQLTMQCTGVTFTTSPVFVVASLTGSAVKGWIVTVPGVATKLPTGSPTPSCTQASSTGSGTGSSFTVSFAPIAAGLSIPSLSNAGGDATNGNFFLTSESPDSGLYGAENTFGGDRAGGNFTGASTANTAFGHNACGKGGSGAFVGSFNVCLGDDAGRNIFKSGGPVNSVTAIGQNACRVTGAGFVTCLGAGAGQAISTGGFGVHVGYLNGSHITTGASNVTIGTSVASTTLQTGSNNVLIGTDADCDTVASSTSNTIQLCAGSTGIFYATGADTPSTSASHVAGTFAIDGSTAHAIQVGEATTALAQVGPCATATQIIGYPTTNADPACMSAISAVQLGAASSAAGATTYIVPGGAGANAASAAPIPFNATVSNFYAVSQNAPAGSETYTATVMSGTCGNALSASSLVATISGTAKTASDTNQAHNLSLTVGQCWSVRLVNSASAAATGVVGFGFQIQTP